MMSTEMPFRPVSPTPKKKGINKEEGQQNPEKREIIWKELGVGVRGRIGFFS